MPMNKVVQSADEAVADIFDGAVIHVGGFAARGVPYELIAALKRKGAKNLTAVCNDIWGGWRNFPDVSVLVANRQVKKLIATFPVPASPTEKTPFEEQWRAGQIELEMCPQGTLAERLRAAGAGIPAFYTPTGAGTQFAEGKETRAFDGREYVLERALKADFALVHAHKGDRYGNLVYNKAARNFNPPMAMAAKVTIAEVDIIVEPGELDPEAVVTPGIFVERIVHAPKKK